MASFDFEQAYDEHAWRLFGFFVQRVGSRADAEDLTQLTFERALAAWHRFDPSKAPLVTWLFAIARNLLIDHHRAAAARPREGVSLEAIDSAREPRVEGPERQVALSIELSAALAALSERERDVLALRFGAELTHPEIAAATGLSLANVQQIVSRALRKLRTELRGGAGASPGPSTPDTAGAHAGAQKASGPTPAAPAAARPSSSSPQNR